MGVHWRSLAVLILLPFRPETSLVSMQFPEVTVSAKPGKGEYIARRFVNYAHTDLGGHPIQGTFTTLNYGTATEFYMVEETSSDGGSGAPITTVPGAE